MKKKVLIILAEGFEEIEAVTPVDVLRRAGLEVTVAGVGGTEITGAHGIRVLADVEIGAYRDTPDAVILPGGLPGASNLAKSPEVAAVVERVRGAGRVIGAICAAPALVLAPGGALDGRKATCYPSFEKQFGPKTKFVTDRVVKDGNVITSRGPGTALEFALELASELAGPQAAAELSKAMIAAGAR